MRIKAKLLLLLIPAIFLVFSLLVGLNYRQASRAAYTHALTLAETTAREYAVDMTDKLDRAVAEAQTLASMALRLRGQDTDPRRLLNEAAAGVASADKDAFGVWVLFAANAFDGRDAEFVDHPELGNAQGRANAYWYREKDGTLAYDPSEDYDQVDFFALPMRERRPLIIEPYRDEGMEDKVLMTSATAVIMENGKPLGVAGVDLGLDELSDAVAGIKPMKTGYAVFFSGSGMIVAAPDKSLAGKPLADVVKDRASEISAGMATGKPFHLEGKSAFTGERVLEMFIPLRLPSVSGSWYFMVALPYDGVMADAQSRLIFDLAVGVGALCFLILLVVFVAGGISKPLGQVCAFASKVADGDTKTQLDPARFGGELRELAEALRAMLQKLLAGMREAEEKQTLAAGEAERAHKAMREAEAACTTDAENRKAAAAVARKVEAVAHRLRTTAGSLAGDMAEAGRRLTEQSSLMRDTVDAVGRIEQATSGAARRAEEAAEFAGQTGERARSGAAGVREAIESVNFIERETQAIGGQMSDLQQRTAGIGEILGVINDIADQTNLLALNAAIEAARAGDAGRGFAVVADEVRKLAEKTVQATKQVDSAVLGIRDSMRQGAEGVDRAVRTVARTVELSTTAGSALSDIVGLVDSVSSQIQEVAALCREQSAGASQVAEVVKRLDELNAHVESDMSRSNTGIAELAPQSKELVDLVDKLAADE